MKKTILHLFILVINVAFSQKSDTLFIARFDDKLSIKLAFDDDIETLQYSQYHLNYDIKPNIDYKMNVSVNYRFIAFNFGVSPHLFSNYDVDLKGKSKKLNFGTDLHFKKWIQSFNYSRVKGFYIPNYPLENNSTTYVKLPRQKITHYSGSTTYKFNNHYSVKALTTQTEIQRISTGTFLPKLQYSYSLYANSDSPQQIETLSFILSAGYLHTFVLHQNLYLGAGVIPGIGIEFYKLSTKLNNTIDITKGKKTIANFDGFMGLGYNSKKFFGGLYYRLIATFRNQTGPFNFDTTNTHVQIFIGYRFNAPNFVKKQVDMIEEKSPFQ